MNTKHRETKELLVDGRPIDYSILPDHMQDSMRLYLEHGIDGGSFMMAVLSNDLMQACALADSINQARLFDFCCFLHNQAPSDSFGSADRVAAWMIQQRHATHKLTDAERAERNARDAYGVTAQEE